MVEKKINWSFNVRRPFCWFVEYYQIMGTNKELFQKVLGIDFSFSNMKKDSDYNEFTDPVEDALCRKIVEEKAKNGLGFLHELAKKSYEKSDFLVATAKKVSAAKFSELSLQEIKLLFDEIDCQLMEYQPVIFMVFPVERFLEERLSGEIKNATAKKGLLEKFDEILCLFSSPKAELAVIREEKSLLKIAIAKKQGKNIEPELQKHIRDFSWIPADGPTEKPWGRNDFLERINSMVENNPAERLEKILSGERKREKDFENLLSNLELGKENEELVNLVRDFVYLRNYRAECWAQATFEIKQFMEFIAKKAGLSIEELIALSSAEISSFFGTGKILSKKEIKERMQAYAYVKIDGKYKAYFGAEAKKKIPSVKELQIVSSRTELKGFIANKGIATGTAKIVFGLADMNKVKAGDILVASMTVPQYIQAMEKAAAFVTDEGGITCHAAIVSREFNIPCIVGTKNATKIFKDGDKIKVDAIKGIVTKI